MLTCIYHKGCLDGFTAAWVVWKKHKGQGKYIPATYNRAPVTSDKIEGRDIVIVDFSYSKQVLEAMAKQANSIVVLDHHKSAKENLEGLDFAHFDMEQSGCMMAWEYFFPDYDPPYILKLIEDRDLWRFKYGDLTRRVNAALFTYPKEFELWDKYMTGNVMVLNALEDQGRVILRDRQRRIDSLVSGWAITRHKIGGHDVPVLNCPRNIASDVLDILAVGEPFAASYFDSADIRQWELRSEKDKGVDVSQIAELYGGGGHKNAAGFETLKPPLFWVDHKAFDIKFKE